MVLKTAPITASASMIEEGLINKEEWGRILAYGTIGAILGKFITGWMADRFGGKFTFTLALLLTSGAIALFSASSTAILFGATFFLALLAKSAGWPSMAKLINNWFRPDQYGKVWGVLSTSSRVGTIIAMFGLGYLLEVLGWRSVLLVASGAGGLIVFYCLFRLKNQPSAQAASAAAESGKNSELKESKPAHPFDGTTLPQALTHFFGSRRFWLITLSMMGLTILWDFLNFVPIYLKETLDVTAAEAARTTTAFPAGSFVSVLIGGYVFDKFDRGRMALVMGGLLAIATACILTLQLVPEMGLGKNSSIYLTIALLFTFGLCVAPCYYLPMSVFSIEYGGIHSGFLIALLDAIAFGASAVFMFFAGTLAEQGWNVFYGVLIAVSAVSMVVTFLFLKGESRLDSTGSPR
jgi:sugar phosphate permease